MHTVTESIFNGSVIVPLADVQHIEPWPKNSVPGIFVITKHTRWDRDTDHWANAIWFSDPEAVEFKKAWCRYRSELESDTLADLAPVHVAEQASSERLEGASSLHDGHAPEGWKLVPEEPSSGMLHAYKHAISRYIDALPEPERAEAKGRPHGYRVKVKTKIRLRYSAMLKAAPTPPALIAEEGAK